MFDWGTGWVNTGRLRGALGSDAYYRLDGRFAVWILKGEAVKRLLALRKVHPDWCGFRIYRGGIRNARLVYTTESGPEFSEWLKKQKG